MTRSLQLRGRSEKERSQQRECFVFEMIYWRKGRRSEGIWVRLCFLSILWEWIGIAPGFVRIQFGDLITYTLGNFGTTYYLRTDN